jgi:hypothetical protein
MSYAIFSRIQETLTRNRWIELTVASGIAVLGSLPFPAGEPRASPTHDLALAAITASAIVLGPRGALVTLLLSAPLELSALMARMDSSPTAGLPAGLRFGAFLITGIAICWVRQQSQEILSAKNLEDRIARIKMASGMLPICAWCSKIVDTRGAWITMEQYLRKYLDVEFTHGFCPECASSFERELDEQRLSKTE